MPVPLNLVYLGSASACAVLAACTDLRSRRVPNWLTGPAAALGVLLHLVLGSPQEGGTAILAALVAGGLFFPLFVVGGLGAGDVKLIAAVSCVSGMHAVQSILLTTVLFGAIISLVTASVNGHLGETCSNVRLLFAHHQLHGFSSHPVLNVQNASLLRLPYAIAIASGCLSTLLLTQLGVIPQ